MIEHGFLDVSWDSARNQAVLTATFPGHPTNTFTLSESHEQGLVFSALNSAVLSKIVYTIKSIDSLSIRYIGSAGGNAFNFSNEFSRANCETRF